MEKEGLGREAQGGWTWMVEGRDEGMRSAHGGGYKKTE